MSKSISLDKSTSKQLPALGDPAAKEMSLRGKGWTLPNVYNLREVKDVYLTVRDNPGLSNKELGLLIGARVAPEGKCWDKKGRKALEYINALRNFQLIDKTNRVSKIVFVDAVLNVALTPADKADLREVFFSYFRFREIMSWFINPSEENHTDALSSVSEDYMQRGSKPLFFYVDPERYSEETKQKNRRYVNAIIYDLKDDTNVYFINPEMSHLMRFWDVFLKWAVTLELLEKFNLLHSDYKLWNAKNILKPKEVTCAYFLSRPTNIDVMGFITSRFNTKHIYLPEAILQICLNFRIRLEEAKRLIIAAAVDDPRFIGFDRTSEIFVKLGEFNTKKQEAIFFPKFKNSFISHLNIR